MFTQFFANYLLQEKYIEKRQLIEGLKKMKNSRVKLGVLAIDSGFLLASQVEEIHAKQSQIDKRFGDIAVELGYLTSTQIDGLLSSQPARYLLLSQSLIDKEYITNNELEVALSKFKEKYDITEENLSDSESSDKLYGVIKSFYDLDGSDGSKNIGTYIKLLLNNLVRFVGDDFITINPDKIRQEDDIEVSQQISGEFTTTTVLRSDEITFLQFVSRYAGEDIPVLDEYAIAVAQDFMNLHNGLFLVNLSNSSNIELRLAPPDMSKTLTIEKDSYILIPIMFTFGIVKFILQK